MPAPVNKNSLDTAGLHKLESLIEFATLLGQQNDYKEILRLVSQKAARLLQAESAVIMMINPQTRQTVKTVFKQDEHAGDRKQHRVQTYVSGWVLKNKQAFASQDITADARFPKTMFKNIAPAAVLGVPLFIEGILLGTIILLHGKPAKSPLENDLTFLSKFAAVIAPFLRNVQKIQQYFDPPIRDDILVQKYTDIGLLGRSEKFVQMLHAAMCGYCWKARAAPARNWSPEPSTNSARETARRCKPGTGKRIPRRPLLPALCVPD